MNTLARALLLSAAVAAATVSVPAWSALQLYVNGRVVGEVAVSNVSLGNGRVDVYLTNSTLKLTRTDRNITTIVETPGTDTSGTDTSGTDTSVPSTPPVSNAPPVSTIGCDTSGVVCENLGIITGSKPTSSTNFTRDVTSASSFSLGAETVAPALTFLYAPGGQVYQQRVWISAEAGGLPLEPAGRCDTGPQTQRNYSLTFVVEGTEFDKGDGNACVIKRGEPYFLNQRILDPAAPSTVVVQRAIAGNF